MSHAQNQPAIDEISALYRHLLDAWNKCISHDFAALFTEDGSVIGFDGSQMNGRTEIESTLSQIFNDHRTGAYVGKIREVRLLTPDSAILRAVGGVIPHGQTDLDPALNTVQTLVAIQQNSQWCITLYQNTPAQLHGRPDLAEQLTQELRQLR